MGDVVILSVVRKSHDARVQDLWDAYLCARVKAERSTDIEDGIAAGKAWAAFLEAFQKVSE